MSRELIVHSPDLARLRQEGFEIEVVEAYLLLKNVPYVNADGKVLRGTLVSTLTLAGERTARPGTHVVMFIGEQPCHKDGSVIKQIEHSNERKQLAESVVVDRSFSNKPAGGYPDYYAKMTTYLSILSGPAESLEPGVTAKTFVDEATAEESVFQYTDTSTARAEIGPVTAHLKGHKVAIVGLGGTGSYVLDLIAKTPVAEIHLFDGDRFLQHNAFRSPGAPSLDELRDAPNKAEHFGAAYSRMHRGIKVHPYYIEPETGDELAGMDFVFLCLDTGQARKVLMDALHKHGKAFIDVGMGLEVVESSQSLVGILRVSTSLPGHREGERHIPTGGEDADGVYGKNIQIADLNCLNASLSVIRWKKLCGFYQDLEHELFTTYAINVNQMLTEGTHEAEDR